ncbi:hypothetical protein [Clostridium butyricum]|uniref:hypothetical protein n=1 Tax=Clostridium butyricum TaxID=1492 RepID=UPI00374F14B1
MQVYHKGQFHKVGQGLFYSGEFEFGNSKNSKFYYVIDCGSADISNKYGYSKIYKHALNLEVELYKKNVLAENNNIINLFVISHMHLDHINGLIDLLKSGVKINKLFLPYLEPSHNIIIVTEYLFEGSKYNSKDEYIEFVMDPIKFLEQFHQQIDEIIFISDSDEEPYRKDDVDNIDESKESAILIGKRNIKLDREIKGKYSKVSVYKECSVKINQLFEFYFFKKKIHDINKIEEFKKAFTHDNIDSDYFKNYKNRRKLKDNYDKLFGKSRFNDTSLCVWMTYIKNPWEIATMYRANNKFENEKTLLRLSRHSRYKFMRFCDFCESYKIEDKFGYVFPGDIDISSDVDFEFFKSHCATISSKIKIFCVQHHGSEHNWNSKLVNEFYNAIWVFSSGTNNSHGHPHNKVLNDISKRRNIIMVDEQQEFIQYTEFEF